MSESRVRATQQSDVEMPTALTAETSPMARLPKITDEDIAVFVEENLSPEWSHTYLDVPLYAVLVYETDRGLGGYLLTMAGDDFLPGPPFGVAHLSTVYFSKCYVRLNKHGGTVSKALLGETKCIAAADLRVASIWLSTSQDNTHTHRFYEEHDLMRVGVKTIPIGDHVCDDCMYKHVLATSWYAEEAPGMAELEDAARWMTRRARTLRA